MPRSTESIGLNEATKTVTPKLDIRNANPDKLVGLAETREIDGRGKKSFEVVNPDVLQRPRTTLEEYKDRFRPKDEQFVGEVGNSLALPDASRGFGAEAKAWLDAHGLKGIEYKDGFPDFSVAAAESIKIDNMTSDKSSNFKQAYEAVAEKWNAEAREGRSDWMPSDVKEWKKANGLDIHEKEDLSTCEFVPHEVHMHYKHVGGRCLASLAEMGSSLNRGGIND